MRKNALLAIVSLLFAPVATAQDKYAGGDISLLSEYEDHGAIYYDTDGTTQITDLLTYFADCGHNAMRVRLFHTPSNASEEEQGEGVVQDLEYVAALGKRIKDAGFAFVLDFHYSDTWADPSNQWTPAAWADLDDDALYDSIYNYTKTALQALVDAGATPDFIQTGNEISYGILWGTEGDYTYKYYASSSSSSVTSRFTSLLQQAAKACREVCPDAKIILHTERVAQPSYLTNFYNAMDDAGVDYDIIGTSYYSYYHGDIDQLEIALNVLESTFDKEIMVVETGYFHSWQPDDVTYDLSDIYPISESGQCAFTEDLINMLNGHEQVTGFFWWDMDANEYGLDWTTQRVTDDWYNAGLFDNETGRAMSAIKLLKNFIDGTVTEGSGSTDDDDEPRELYMMGNTGLWNYDISEGTLTETAAGSDIYYGEDIQFSANWFDVFSRLGSWDAAYRYGPPANNTEIVIGTPADLQYNTTNSFYISASDYGTYDVTVDLSQMTILLSDGTDTGISELSDASNASIGGTAVYNLAGQRMGNTLQGLAPGIYIYGGRKVAVRR